MSFVIWITGLPGSGKSTLARELQKFFLKHGIVAVNLDGDELRIALDVKGSYERDSRIALAKQYSRLAHLISNQNVNVIVSTVSLFHEVHDFNRKSIPRYVEVFLDYPIDLLLTGPRMEMYKGSTLGYLKEISPEFPTTPEIRLVASSEDDRRSWFKELVENLPWSIKQQLS